MGPQCAAPFRFFVHPVDEFLVRSAADMFGHGMRRIIARNQHQSEQKFPQGKAIQSLQVHAGPFNIGGGGTHNDRIIQVPMLQCGNQRHNLGCTGRIHDFVAVFVKQNLLRSCNHQKSCFAFYRRFGNIR